MNELARANETADGRPVIVAIRIGYSWKTAFTRGAEKTNSPASR